ncbi:MAG: TRAP transporter small permease [Betaproteobacteria bacterium]
MNPQALGREPDRVPQSFLARAWHWLDENIEYWLNFLFYSFLTSIIVIEVFRRYVLNSSTVYGEEVARYAFIWLAYIATARGVKNRSHLSIENIRGRMGRTGKFVLYLVSDACFLTLAAIVVLTSIRMVSSGIQFDQRMTGSDLPIWIATGAIPVAWSLICLRVIQRSLVTIRNFRAGGPIEAGTLVPVE